MYKYRRVIISAIAGLLVLVMLSSFIFMAVNAASSSEIKEQLSELEDKAKELDEQKEALNEEIEASKGTAATIAEQKWQLDRQVSLTIQEIDNTNAMIQQYNELIAEKQAELDAAVAEEQELFAAYKHRLRAMEEGGTISYWSVLFKSKSISDMLDRIEMIREIAEGDQRMLAELEESARVIAAAKEELAAEKVALESKKLELAAAEETLAAQRVEADAMLAKLSEELYTMQDEADRYDKLEEELDAEIAKKEKEYTDAKKAEDEEKNKNNGSGSSGGNSGGGTTAPSSSGWMYPLPSGVAYISSTYGYRVDPVTGQRGAFHGGVDFACAKGTPVYASRAGTVNVAEWGNYIYGNYVTINHGDGFSSLYGHMTSFIVVSGQYVTQGQLIGYVGSTGKSTGPHLHFGIYYNGSSVNPMNYVSLK